MKIKTGLLLILVLSFTLTLPAQPEKYQADKEESFITYRLTHPLHEVEATSHESLCLIYADASKHEILNVLVQVPVSTFDSGNSNRDSHAMEVIDAISIPTAKFVSTKVEQEGDSLNVYGKLTFHGVTKDIIIKAFTNWYGDSLIVNGKFDISLTAFKVDRPSLLLIPVNDTLKFTIKQVFDLRSPS